VAGNAFEGRTFGAAGRHEFDGRGHRFEGRGRRFEGRGFGFGYGYGDDYYYGDNCWVWNGYYYGYVNVCGYDYSYQY
jgi:hypothetical protein